MKVTPGTITRTICLIIAIFNQILAFAGKDVIPFAEDDLYQIVSLIFTSVTAVAAWWKNNSFTKAAICADKFIKDLKSGKIASCDLPKDV